jgi:signal transduction histidine kinase
MLAELHRTREDKERLLARTVEIAEQERTRVAADLHDGPIQRLTVVSLTADLLESRIEAGDLAAAGELAEAIRADLMREMTSLRRLMSELRPPVLTEGGLLAALTNCAMQTFGDTPRCEIHGDIDGAELAPEVETALYRVAREALVNIRKHADATAVDVLLERRNGAVRLVVADDGAGFDFEGTADGSQHLGIIGMREVAESVGASCSIITSRGAGTRVEAIAPVRGDGREGGAPSLAGSWSA